MSCIQTYTGILFDPLHPDPAQIHITDIAHALSLLCRANGHFKTFYSVGQHCINCMHEAVSRGYSHKVQLACLLHDASEAYLSDVTRPVKQELPQYIQIEKPLQEAIWNKYLGEPLTQEEYEQVFSIDDAMLYYEFVALMGTKLTEEVPPLYSTPEVQFMGFESCEQRYLACFHELMGSKQEIGSEKSARYQTLVEKVRLSYLTYDGPPDGKNPRLSWCDACQEINLWTYWQGRGNLDAKILLVGQDWGCIENQDGKQWIETIECANKGLPYDYMAQNSSETDKNLIKLFKEGIHLDIEKPCSEVFFTNFVLGYRNEGTSGGFKKEWIHHDKGYFLELVEIIQPKVILCLGRDTFEGVLTAFGIASKVKIESYNAFIESAFNPVSVTFSNGNHIFIFALAHCGAMGTLNRNEKRHTGLEKQIRDWQRIKPYIEGKINAANFTT